MHSSCPDCSESLSRWRYCRRCDFRVPRFSRGASQIIATKQQNWPTLLLAQLVDEAFSRRQMRPRRLRGGANLKRPITTYRPILRWFDSLIQRVQTIGRAFPRQVDVAKGVRGAVQHSEYLVKCYKQILVWEHRLDDRKITVPNAREIERAMEAFARSITAQFARIPFVLHAANGKIERRGAAAVKGVTFRFNVSTKEFNYLIVLLRRSIRRFSTGRKPGSRLTSA